MLSPKFTVDVSTYDVYIFQTIPLKANQALPSYCTISQRDITKAFHENAVFCQHEKVIGYLKSDK